MTADTMPRPALSLSPDWLRRLQRGLTTLSVLATAAAAFSAGAVVYAAVKVDDNVLQFVTGKVDQVETYLEFASPPDGAPYVYDGNPMGVRMQVFDVLTWLPGLILAVVLLWLLRGVVRRARDTDPFHPDTARRLRRAGWVALIGGLLAGAAERVGYGLAFLIDPTNGVSSGEQGWAWVPFSLRALVFELPWAWLAVGVALLAIAAVFARGIAMRRDLDGLV